MFDLIVIGAGAAGLCAAIEARRAGASVLILEAADAVGGSTALSGGVVLAAGTQLQRDRGVEDHPDAFYDRYMVINRWSVEPHLARALCSDAAEAVEWLSGFGVKFHLLPANSAELTPRSHMADGSGAKIARVLELEATRSGVEIRRGSRVGSLERKAEGFRVEMASSNEVDVGRAVVIATGGFGASREMLAKHYPTAAVHGDLTWSVAAQTCVGDGLELGGTCGAGLTGHDRGLALITPGFEQNFDVVPPAWLVFVNREGQRYVDEMMPYSMLTETTHQQSGGIGFAVLDEATRAQAAPTNLTHQGVVSLDWNRDSIAVNSEKGLVFRAESLRELAAEAGIDAESLEQTLSHYNADCEAGRDSRFHKESSWMRPVAQPPFYAAEIRPCLVALTCCGLRIDANAQVLSQKGEPISGLFAAGETTGGVLRQYGGSGNSIASALVFGRRAGRAVGALVKGES